VGFHRRPRGVRFLRTPDLRARLVLHATDGILRFSIRFAGFASNEYRFQAPGKLPVLRILSLRCNPFELLTLDFRAICTTCYHLRFARCLNGLSTVSLSVRKGVSHAKTLLLCVSSYRFLSKPNPRATLSVRSYQLSVANIRVTPTMFPSPNPEGCDYRPAPD